MVERQPLAIVGVDTLFPGSVDARGFWSDLLAGRDQLRDVPPSHWLIEDYYDPDPSAPDKTYAKRGAFLGDVELDPIKWGIPPSNVPSTDTSQLLALIVAQRVLDDATGGEFAEMDRSRVSVILGVTGGQELLGNMVSRLQRPIWAKALRESGLGDDQVESAITRILSHYTPWQESTFPGLLGNVVAGRIANRLDLGGTNCITDAACASSMSALAMAANELHLGDSDMVLTGGVDTMNDVFMYMCFSKTPALSPSGDCRPFSQDADGTMLGEGIGMLALKRLEDAERDDDHVYALLRGIGSSSDGRSKSVYAPLPQGQARALRRAYERAGYGPETVEMVEAHGTGTTAGDAAEFEALRKVFEASGRDDRGWCALGSVKSQIGHTKAAAGAAGLCKAVLSLHHGALPPIAKVDAPNPALDLDDSPFSLCSEPRPWIRDSTHERRASVSSFGFGGSNFHVALSEYRGPARRPERFRALDAELVTLSGDEDSLLAAARRHAVAASSEGYLRWLSQTSATTFDAAAPCRLAVIAGDEAELAARLEAAVDRLRESPGSGFRLPGVHCGTGASASLDEVAFLFPGQGSQYPRMLGSLALAFEPALAAWDLAAKSGMADGLDAIVFPADAFDDSARSAQIDRLTATESAQPAIACGSLSMLAILGDLGLRPRFLAGHSFGEVTALHAGGAFNATDLVAIARRRGELMRDLATTPGAMLAISCSAERAERVIGQLDNEITVANHNGPDQIVLSGTVDSVRAAEQSFNDARIKTYRLPVGTAFHSPIVAPASAALSHFLAETGVEAPTIPVYSNTTAGRYPADPAEVRSLLADQLSKPVRFAQMVTAMHDDGARIFVEVGPGSVLTGLVAGILGLKEHLPVCLDRKGVTGIGSFFDGVGALAAAGLPLDLTALWTGYRKVANPHEAEKPKLSISINGSNFGRPYPPSGTEAADASHQSIDELDPGSPRGDRDDRETRPDLGQATPAPMSVPAEAATTAMPHPPAAANGNVSSPDLRSEQRPRHPQPQLCPDDFEAPNANGAVGAGSDLASTPWQSGTEALLAIHAQATEVHASCIHAIGQLHEASLRSCEAVIALVSELRGVEHATHAAPVFAPSSPELDGSPGAEHGANSAPGAIRPAASPGNDPEIADEISTGSVSLEPATGSAVPVSMSGDTPSPAQMTELLLAVVAEKTGYPPEMLEMGMELEGDLGIDSIKRVEILAGMRERVSELPEVEVSELAELSTLGQIADYMSAHAGDPGVTAGAAEAISAPDPLPPEGAVAGSQATLTRPESSPAQMTELLLAVVAEKTGYPPEMLEMGMELEGDLGIDSIKRVEILAGMRERVSELPEVEVSELAELSTLGQIADYMSAHAGDPGVTAGAAEAISAPDPLPPEGEPTDATAGPLGRYGLEVIASPARGIALPGLGSGLIAVIGDESPLAESLAFELRSRGVESATASSPPPDCAGVVLLTEPPENPASATASALAAFEAVRSATSGFDDVPGVLVTVQQSGGDFGISGSAPSAAWGAGLAGLARCAARELPEASIRAIDIARDDRPAEEIAVAIADELTCGGIELEVGLGLDGNRVTLIDQPEPADAAGLPIGADDVIVVSGGGRGVTAACVVELARRSGATFVILGRTALDSEPGECANAADDPAVKRALLSIAERNGTTLTPAELGRKAEQVLACREIRATLAAIESGGGKARYVVADVVDSTALAAALVDVRAEFGQVTGLVHGAGILADKLIAEKSADQFRAVYSTKVDGLRALLEVTAEDDLRTICVFSSVAARYGNAGQADYAMANEVLAKVASAEQSRRGARCRVKSIAWGPWAGGMVGPELQALFEKRGVDLVDLSAGSKAFVDELSDSRRTEVTIAKGTNPAALAQAEVPSHRASFGVSLRTHPQLLDHAIRGEVVLPVAFAVEWMTRASIAFNPTQNPAGLANVKVLAGITTPGFAEGAPAWFEVRQVAPGSPELQLVGPSGAIHYSAEAIFDPTRETKLGVAELGELEPVSGGVPYGGRSLFHGPAFQAIERVDGISDQAIRGQLRGVSESGWPAERWLSDPAALDGVLQLAVLWIDRVLDAPALPTGLGSVNFVGRPAAGLLDCTIIVREKSDLRAVGDAVVRDANGNAVIEVSGLEAHVLPSGGD